MKDALGRPPVLCRQDFEGVHFRHARAGRHPGIASRSRELTSLDSRFRGNDTTLLTPHFYMDEGLEGKFHKLQIIQFLVQRIYLVLAVGDERDSESEILAACTESS